VRRRRPQEGEWGARLDRRHRFPVCPAAAPPGRGHRATVRRCTHVFLADAAGGAAGSGRPAGCTWGPRRRERRERRRCRRSHAAADGPVARISGSTARRASTDRIERRRRAAVERGAATNARSRPIGSKIPARSDAERQGGDRNPVATRTLERLAREQRGGRAGGRGPSAERAQELRAAAGQHDCERAARRMACTSQRCRF